MHRTCFSLKGFNNSHNILIQPKSIKSGLYFGLSSDIFIPNNLYVSIYMNDRVSKPALNELDSLNVDTDNIATILIKKGIDEKLAEPYNRCKNNI